LVKVAVDKNDKRSRRLSLTKAGKELLAAAKPIWLSEHAAVERMLGKPTPDQMREGLSALS
ncbi:MAG: MarR family winged helix-turn-helix transcriptional regulator, partial [Pseudorhodoplanes sp.]